jgi:hypothetical protein
MVGQWRDQRRVKLCFKHQTRILYLMGGANAVLK